MHDRRRRRSWVDASRLERVPYPARAAVSSAGSFMLLLVLLERPLAVLTLMQETGLTRNSVQYHAQRLARAGLLEAAEVAGSTGYALREARLAREIAATLCPEWFEGKGDEVWGRLQDEIQRSRDRSRSLPAGE